MGPLDLHRHGPPLCPVITEGSWPAARGREWAARARDARFSVSDGTRGTVRLTHARTEARASIARPLGHTRLTKTQRLGEGKKQS